MNNNSVLLTGITGYLGSHIAERFSKSRLVIGLVRKGSDLWRYEEIRNNNIVLLDYDDENLEQKLIELKPALLIHAAWGGVAAKDRDSWIPQSKNITFTMEVLQLATKAGVKSFIGLGSQAEYGYFNGRINEEYPAAPLSAYGAAKLATSQMIKSYCTLKDMDWYWLRLFPMFGVREDLNWFIPMVIDHALKNKPLDLTGCEQLYSYLHVDDFSEAVQKVADSCGRHNLSGVYNLAANQPQKLRDIIELIKEKVGSGFFNFGALPYRDNQVMHMEGDAQKFFNTFDFVPKKNFQNSIDDLIGYYRSKEN